MYFRANVTSVEGFLIFIIYAFQKPADVIDGCQSQVVHWHEKTLFFELNLPKRLKSNVLQIQKK